MLQSLRSVLRDKRGSGLIGICVALLIVTLIGSVALELHQRVIIAANVEEMVRKATVTMAVNNSYDAYSGVRDARSNAYRSAGNGNWSDSSSVSDLTNQLRSLFSLQGSGNRLTHYNQRGVEFVLDIHRIESVNEFSDGDTLQFDVSYRLTIPMRFLGEEIPAAPLERTTRASYTPRY